MDISEEEDEEEFSEYEDNNDPFDNNFGEDFAGVDFIGFNKDSEPISTKQSFKSTAKFSRVPNGGLSLARRSSSGSLASKTLNQSGRATEEDAPSETGSNFSISFDRNRQRSGSRFVRNSQDRDRREDSLRGSRESLKRSFRATSADHSNRREDSTELPLITSPGLMSTDIQEALDDDGRQVVSPKSGKPPRLRLLSHQRRDAGEYLLNTSGGLGTSQEANTNSMPLLGESKTQKKYINPLEKKRQARGKRKNIQSPLGISPEERMFNSLMKENSSLRIQLVEMNDRLSSLLTHKKTLIEISHKKKTIAQRPVSAQIRGKIEELHNHEKNIKLLEKEKGRYEKRIALLSDTDYLLTLKEDHEDKLEEAEELEAQNKLLLLEQRRRELNLAKLATVDETAMRQELEKVSNELGFYLEKIAQMEITIEKTEDKRLSQLQSVDNTKIKLNKIQAVADRIQLKALDEDEENRKTKQAKFESLVKKLKIVTTGMANTKKNKRAKLISLNREYQRLIKDREQKGARLSTVKGQIKETEEQFNQVSGWIDAMVKKKQAKKQKIQLEISEELKRRRGKETKGQYFHYKSPNGVEEKIKVEVSERLDTEEDQDFFEDLKVEIPNSRSPRASNEALGEQLSTLTRALKDVESIKRIDSEEMDRLGTLSNERESPSSLGLADEKFSTVANSVINNDGQRTFHSPTRSSIFKSSPNSPSIHLNSARGLPFVHVKRESMASLGGDPNISAASSTNTTGRGNLEGFKSFRKRQTTKKSVGKYGMGALWSTLVIQKWWRRRLVALRRYRAREKARAEAAAKAFAEAAKKKAEKKKKAKRKKNKSSGGLIINTQQLLEEDAPLFLTPKEMKDLRQGQSESASVQSKSISDSMQTSMNATKLSLSKNMNSTLKTLDTNRRSSDLRRTSKIKFNPSVTTVPPVHPHLICSP